MGDLALATLTRLASESISLFTCQIGAGGATLVAIATTRDPWIGSGKGAVILCRGLHAVFGTHRDHLPVQRPASLIQ